MTLSLSLIEISPIEDTKNEVELKISAEVTWNETRASYLNLKLNPEDNILKTDEKAKLWIPKLAFENSKDKYDTGNHLSETKLLILRQGEPEIRNDGKANNRFYRGDENPIVLALTTTLNIRCDKNYNAFPFDKQVL